MPGAPRYTFPSASFTISGAKSVTEDLSWFRGAIVGCGEAAALVIAHIINGQPLSPNEVTNLIISAANAGRLNGAGNGQTASDVQWDLAHYGINSAIQYTNQPGAPAFSTMGAKIDAALKAGMPVELGVSSGNQLTGEPSGLRGHFITIVGESQGQFVVADPNTSESKSGGLVLDTWQQLQDANPFALIIPTGKGASIGPVTNTNNTSNGGSPSIPGIDLSGITDAVNNLGTNIGQGFLGAFTSPFKNVGISSFTDFGWRAILIAFAFILILMGASAIAHDVGGQAMQSASQNMPPVIPV